MRIGAAYFADLVDRFGGVHLRAGQLQRGPGAVARWIAERPGIAADEFIDDIPYPETQEYVRKIIGTAEDYRRLYGTLGAGSRPSVGVASRDLASFTSSSRNSCTQAPDRRTKPSAQEVEAEEEAPLSPCADHAKPRHFTESVIREMTRLAHGTAP